MKASTTIVHTHTSRAKTVGKTPLPVGKLPLKLLERLLRSIPSGDPNILAGPGIGVDAAVVRFGDQTLVFKTDPITFTSEDISRYLVTINANDIACMGGIPRYLLVTFLLPAGPTTPASVEELFSDLRQACAAGSLIVAYKSHGVERPTIGLLIRKKDAPSECRGRISSEENPHCGVHHRLGHGRRHRRRQGPAACHHDPGISIFKEGQNRLGPWGAPPAHDPTEGGACHRSESQPASGWGEAHRIHPVLPIAKDPAGIDPLPLWVRVSGLLRGAPCGGTSPRG